MYKGEGTFKAGVIQVGPVIKMFFHQRFKIQSLSPITDISQKRVSLHPIELNCSREEQNYVL